MMEDGLGILGAAHVPALLEELVEAIRTKYADVKLKGPRLSLVHGSVSFDVNWNFRNRAVAPVTNIVSMSYHTFSVIAELAKRDITVSTLQGWLVMEPDDWADQENVARALVAGLQNPFTDRLPKHLLKEVA